MAIHGSVTKSQLIERFILSLSVVMGAGVSLDS
jgi:hypothetical protein